MEKSEGPRVWCPRLSKSISHAECLRHEKCRCGKDGRGVDGLSHLREEVRKQLRVNPFQRI